MNKKSGSAGVFITVFLAVVAVLLFFFYRGSSFIPGSESAKNLYPDNSSSSVSIGITKGVNISSRGSSSDLGYKIGTDSSDSNGPKGIYIGEAGTSGSNSSYSGIYTISYTNEGFSPSSLILSGANRTVKFVNNSNNLMWVIASGEWQPLLSSGYGLAPGAVYSYTFPDKVGIYGYQNRLNSSHSGLVSIK
jgi:hypothetical protein